MDLNRDRRVTILASEPEFSVWKELADEGPFKNLSDFIRCCTNIHAAQILQDKECAEQMEKEGVGSLGTLLVEASKQKETPEDDDYDIYADLTEEEIRKFCPGFFL